MDILHHSKNQGIRKVEVPKMRNTFWEFCKEIL